MKKILFLFFASIISVGIYAQAPEAFKYQAVVRDAAGVIIANQSVSFRLSIHQTGTTGAVVYAETQTLSTNVYGLANMQIGNGTLVSGSFSTINWAAGPYFLEVEFDPNGGAAFTTMGTSQLLSVPYALYSKTSGSSTPGPVGPAGSQGVQGNQGIQGVAGPSGVTGQSVTEVYGTAQIVPVVSAIYTLIPGLSQTINVPSNCRVLISTDGGVQCSLAGANFATVDIGIHVDGVISAQGGQRRIVAANTTSLGQVISNWAITKSYNLSAGNHTIDVRVADLGSGSADANVSSGSAPLLQGTLTISIIKL